MIRMVNNIAAHDLPDYLGANFLFGIHGSHGVTVAFDVVNQHRLVRDTVS